MVILIVKVREDLSGRRYGNLTVIKQTEDGVIAGKNVPMWLCRCDCGKIKSVLGDSLKRGKLYLVVVGKSVKNHK